MYDKKRYDFRGSSAVMLLVIAIVLLARYLELFTLSWYLVVPIALVTAVIIASLISTITSSGDSDRAVDEEISILKKAIVINPTLAQAYNNLGWAYHKHKGMLNEAIVQYKKALEIDPNYAEAHNNLGLAYGEKEMIDDAISELQKAIAINPNLASAHNDLALGYFSKQQFKLAIKHADIAKELGADVDAEFLRMLKPYR